MSVRNTVGALYSKYVDGAAASASVKSEFCHFLIVQAKLYWHQVSSFFGCNSLTVWMRLAGKLGRNTFSHQSYQSHGGQWCCLSVAGWNDGQLLDLKHGDLFLWALTPKSSFYIELSFSWDLRICPEFSDSDKFGSRDQCCVPMSNFQVPWAHKIPETPRKC